MTINGWLKRKVGESVASPDAGYFGHFKYLTKISIKNFEKNTVDSTYSDSHVNEKYFSYVKIWLSY